MTQKDIDERIKAIEAMQNAFDVRVESTEASLLVKVLTNWEKLREKLFPTFKKMWNEFLEQDYIPLIESFVSDIKTVVQLNETYFADTVPTKELFERLGVEESGIIIRDGYTHTILQDQTVKREVQQFLNRTKQLKFDQKVKQDVTKLIKGDQGKPGVVKKFTDDNVAPTYNEADRVIQQGYADVHFLSAGMYTGGIIETTRPFCKERNRKMFLRDEIALFGTPQDKFGGYSDKSIGMFSGKPKTGYDPFTQCGGYRCRHHWSWLADEYAVRQDKTLFIKDGKLQRV